MYGTFTQLPPKLTYHSPLKIDVWKTIRLPFLLKWLGMNCQPIESIYGSSILFTFILLLKNQLNVGKAYMDSMDKDNILF